MFAASTIGTEDFKTGFQAPGSAREAWMTPEMAEQILNHSGCLSLVRTHVRNAKHEFPARVGRWCRNDIKGWLEQHPNLSMNQSTLESFVGPKEEGEETQKTIHSPSHSDGYCFLFAPTEGKVQGEEGYKRHDRTNSPFSEGFFATCLQATLPGGALSCYVPDQGAGAAPGSLSIAPVPLPHILRTAVVLKYMLRCTHQPEAPELMEQMQVSMLALVYARHYFILSFFPKSGCQATLGGG
jgi:hypothetical protein